MIGRPRLQLLRRASLYAAATIALAAGALAGVPGTAQAAGSLPCDIYAAAGTPCVAAHSTTRALFSAYSGNLYQVKRWSDSATANIATLSAGGYANAAAQNTFCAGTSCTITVIYDQTSRHNNLTIQGPGGNGGQDYGANAAALPLTAGGHAVYGLYVSAGVGYRNNATSGVATGSAPEGMYMVTAGTHVNNRCCFDYGNAETSGNDTGNGHMDAINFGTECWFSPCSGSGPWVQADLENGLFAGGNGSWSANTGRSSAFVTAMLKNNGTTTYAIKDGNAQSGSLATRYNGALPNLGGYAPMHKEGAIVLGTGGDNSNGSVGSFYEGVMTSGYPTDAADNAVQANIVSVGYTSSTSFPVTGTAYRITNVNSGKVLDAINCGTANGTLIDLWSSLGNTCQQWKFTSAGTGYYTLTNVNSGTVLDSVNCGWADGTAVDLWSSLGNLCQKWSVIPTGNNHYELVVATSGMVLDAVNCGTANGTRVDQWQWLNNTCQEWSIAP
jgi:non-reducing end alpha-L-arabinofuranosidase